MPNSIKDDLTPIALIISLASLVISVLALFGFFINSQNILLLSGLILIGCALWWKYEAKKFALNHFFDGYTPCWRTLLFFILLILGAYSILAYFNNSLIFIEYTSSKVTNSNLASPVKSDSLFGKFSQEPSLWIALFTAIIVVTTAYYLVSLQGTLAQTKELLKELEKRSQEVRRLQNQVVAANNNANSVLKTVGGITSIIAVALKNNLSGNLKENVTKASKVLDSILSLHDQFFLIRNNSTQVLTINLVLIDTKITEITNVLNNYPPGYQFVPLGLLAQIHELIEYVLQHQQYSAEERQMAAQILRKLTDLERLIIQATERL